jgi:hypothetical protein
MTSSPFEKRRSSQSSAPLQGYPCLRRGMTMEEFVAEQNERHADHPRIKSGELRWVVGFDGQPRLETQPHWLARYQRDEARNREEERRKFIHRQRHPVGE